MSGSTIHNHYSQYVHVTVLGSVERKDDSTEWRGSKKKLNRTSARISKTDAGAEIEVEVDRRIGYQNHEIGVDDQIDLAKGGD